MAAQFTAETTERGEWNRQANRFTGRIARDAQAGPGDGPDDQSRWPVEPGRYRLVVCRACPWAHRSIIVRQLLGLENAISMAVVDPVRDDNGWRFTLDPGGTDPVLGISYLSEAYLRTDPSYDGRVTVPAIVDTVTGLVVTNDYPQITLDMSTEWVDHHRAGAPRLIPADRTELDRVMDEIYQDVNNGVYKAGFATNQEAYESAYDALFARLDQLEERLTGREFLLGDELSEADIRLFTTLVRFDAVYHGHFKCNRNKLTEFPQLWRYARRLYQREGFGETVDFDQIKRHYYVTHHTINPTGIVPKGPDPRAWDQPITK